ncbi:fructose 1,6-bisphosphatase [Streptomyces sp. NPDC007875]|uniref:fructose 1,6-bisphosphatase n=1 Tax=Streptomyces sp. NPDC007875 TaxID=3364783 RepID=UPI0036981286
MFHEGRRTARSAPSPALDGPPRVAALGVQISHGRLIGYPDLFDDPAFDDARRPPALHDRPPGTGRPGGA